MRLPADLLVFLGTIEHAVARSALLAGRLFANVALAGILGHFGTIPHTRLVAIPRILFGDQGDFAKSDFIYYLGNRSAEIRFWCGREMRLRRVTKNRRGSNESFAVPIRVTANINVVQGRTTAARRIPGVRDVPEIKSTQKPNQNNYFQEYSDVSRIISNFFRAICL